MIRISNISFFRFCWKNEKLDWPKCARTVPNTSQHMLKTLCWERVEVIVPGTAVPVLFREVPWNDAVSPPAVSTYEKRVVSAL